MARQTRLAKWVDSNGSVELLRRWDLGGNDRVILAQEIGYLSNGSGNVTGLYNQLNEEGYIGDGSVRVKSDTPRNSKVSGVLPMKTANSIALALGLDIEEIDVKTEIGYLEYLKALEIKGNDWISLLLTRLGGADSDGAKQFLLWIESNEANLEKRQTNLKVRIAKPVCKAIANARKSGLDTLANDLENVLKFHGIELDTETETDE